MNREELSECIMTINSITCGECYAIRTNDCEDRLLDQICAEGWVYCEENYNPLCPLCQRT